MEALLKTTFPKHRIYDATNKNDKEREFIIQLCIKIESVIMYVVRNEMNEQFFKKYESKHSNTRIGLLFFNKDDYIYFPDDTYCTQSKETDKNILKVRL